MKHRVLRLSGRMLAVLLILSMLLTMAGALETGSGAAAAETTDATAFGSAANITTEAWVNNALSTAECRALLNAQTLQPQTTGWKELDSLMDSLLAPYAGQDTYTKVRAMYDWLVKNLTYSWDGYSKKTAPAYEYFTELDYLSTMTYTPCMKKSIPDDMANRTMHVLTAKKGVCYDYAIAFAVLCRYIGIESYVRTGYFSLESGGFGHHGWTVLVLSGTEYIFDAQRDARNWEYHGWNGYYFGVTQEKAGSYYPNYAAADRSANPERNASMLAMTADREDASGHVWKTVTAQSTCTKTGTITHTCTLCGKTETETTPALGHSWNKGKLTTPQTAEQDGIATFTCKRCGAAYTVELPAGGSPFVDVQDQEQYYYAPVLWAADSGITTGADTLHFAPGKGCTRAQVITFLWRMAGEPEAEGEIPFTDVSADSWYYRAVQWGYLRGIVHGTSKTTFSPDAKVTRAEFITFLYRYAGEPEIAEQESPFTDLPDQAYYRAAVLWGYQEGIVKGTDPDRFSPDESCRRAQVVTFLYRAEQAGVGSSPEMPEPEEDSLPEGSTAEEDS